MHHATRSTLICLVDLLLPVSTTIILAVFGTLSPPGLPGILHIRKRMQKRFPGAKSPFAFTSL